jgi:hypothetical protein
MALSSEFRERTSRWIPQLSSLWHEEIPVRIHTRGFDEAGNPQLHPEFVAWLNGQGSNSASRTRLTTAMRRLRKQSIREYEVAYRVIVLGERPEGTMAWLNERAIRNSKPERYSLQDTEVIICSAVDKLLSWY